MQEFEIALFQTQIFNFKIYFQWEISVGQAHVTKFSFCRKFSSVEMGRKWALSLPVYLYFNVSDQCQWPVKM